MPGTQQVLNSDNPRDSQHHSFIYLASFSGGVNYAPGTVSKAVGETQQRKAVLEVQDLTT